MENIAFFDLELFGKTDKKIRQIGAWWDGQAWKGSGVHALEQFCGKVLYRAGHNIFDYDIPFLEKFGASKQFLQGCFIDTLYLSALFFANKPYHRLVKEYRLERQDNDPVEDAKLSMVVFADCLAAFLTLPIELQTIFRTLLRNTSEFHAFFHYVEETALADQQQEPEALSLKQMIQSCFQSRLCEYANLELLIQQQPVPLAYALALIQAADTASVTPGWLLHRFPELPQLMHQLRATPCHDPQCSYCPQHLSPIAGLKRFFDYPSFRKFDTQEDIPLQQQVVEAALKGESLLAIFPTGGGKSLAFQLPALMQGEANRGLTVVISPLQALMKDQVDVLKNRFEISRAVAINGLLSPLERAEAIQRVREGDASLLYISPESLRSNTIRNLLKTRHIERFVIDEAHCFSSWGQDFRTDYLYIGRFLQELSQAKNLTAPIPVSCFTATAKPQVITDILDYFQDQVAMQVYRTSSGRKNLSYYVHATDYPDEKLPRLIGLLQTTSEPAIVYVSRTRMAEQLALSLKKAGLKAACFHGKMEPKTKIKIQEEFISDVGEIDVIVATSAFGMGVDKDDVGMVVHYDIPDSLENYLQEAGRAGRKPDMQAHCHLLFDENDLSKHFNLLNQTKLSQKEISQIWKAIKEFKGRKFSKSALEIARQAGWDTDMAQLETQVKSALAALEDTRYIRRHQNAPSIFAKSILVKNVEAANNVIHAHAHLLSDNMMQDAIRIFQYLISREETLVDYMAEDLGISVERTARILYFFQDWKLLDDKNMTLTAFINPSKRQKGSLPCFHAYAQLERALLDILLPSAEAPTIRQVYLRDLNHQLQEDGMTDSSVEAVRTLLQYWESRHYIYKERLDAHTLLYKIRFREHRKELITDMQDRQALTTQVVQWLCREEERQVSQGQKTPDGALSFSMRHLQQAVEHGDLFAPTSPLVAYEAALLYLNFIGAIKLEGGLFIFYNRMTLEQLEQNPRRQYRKDDYEKLAHHYQQKTEQIHIIGEYAKKHLASYQEALTFVDDYFQLPYPDFIHKYFRHKKGVLKQPITEKKFEEIFGALSEEQLAVVKDKEHNRILVGAGPGSGKTRVLVHKVASLLTMEDIKTDQFLMLTFSRPAALEFKERLYQLIGSAAYYIDIFTFHGYAFRLLGKLGDLNASEQVIPTAIAALQNEDIPTGSIKAKSVIVVDEYQDISQVEYDFLQWIAKIAEDVRIIVVGDDDQNIYEFRGSSVAFMRHFAKDHQAKTYHLTKNYRACANLVSFSNQFLGCFSADRLKAGHTLIAHRKERGDIRIHQHDPSASLITPVVGDVAAQALSGTTAVLTSTNEEALLVMLQLQQQGIPARLIATQNGFSLSQLLELKTFTHVLKQVIRNELGFIPPEDWQRSREQLGRQYASSENLPLAQQVISAFEQTTSEKRFWSDWLAYLQQVRSEDFVMPEENRVFVSTMHKAKGKEFDHVFLLLQGYALTEESRKRVVYVAITRAKQSLHIYTDQPYFSSLWVENLQVHQDSTVYPAPEALEIECAMNQVWLDHFKKAPVARSVKSLQAGMRLGICGELSQGLYHEHQEIVVKFSRKFQERLFRYLAQGYHVHQAIIAYIVIWYCPEDGKEYRVVLPKLHLKKRDKSFKHQNKE
ncbi:MAG: RecQ family ATP-dependent DNA helicase [Cyclobacteriaceae bacterium]